MLLTHRLDIVGRSASIMVCKCLGAALAMNIIESG